MHNYQLLRKIIGWTLLSIHEGVSWKKGLWFYLDIGYLDEQNGSL